MKGLKTGAIKEDHGLLCVYHSSHNCSDKGNWRQMLQDKVLPLSSATLLWDFMLACLQRLEPQP